MILLLAKLQKLKPLWNVLSPRRRRQLLGLQILSLAAAAGEVANLGALLPFLRLLANPKEGLQALGPLALPLRSLPEQHLLLSLGFGFLIVVLLSTGLRIITLRSQLRLAALIATDIGKQVFEATLYRPFAWHLENNSSKVLTYITKDVDHVNSSIQQLLDLMVNLAIVFLLSASLIAVAPSVMLVVGALLAGFYLLVFRFTKATMRSDGEQLRSYYQLSLQLAQEGLGGIRDVILERSQQFFVQSYSTNIRSCRLAGSSINANVRTPRFLIEGFTVVLIVGLSLSLALTGQGIEQQLPLLGILSLGAYRLLQPLQQCFSALSTFQANQASLLRLRPFLQVTKSETEKNLIQSMQLAEANGLEPLIELRQLSYRYSSDGPWVLSQLDLYIQPGERIGFVGSTGSGKSTISDLILGLLTPTEGQVLVNGAELHTTPGLVQAWQQYVAHVPQSIYLSDASFAANIAFGTQLDRIDFQRVRLVAEQARIAEVIESSSDGYSTIVGERGVKLSGGQRQRIGLARALYKQAKILVLDEATSALDNRTEAEIIDSIESLNGKITIIIIAHRMSTVKRCDRIIHLEKGKIVGLDSYPELLGKSPDFRKLALDDTRAST